ncbi:MAG: hypothetical protein COT84_06795 [Chlamydiae bacterium CG10_big_fil_rev_8_21_14_0_10_35_9]|nr:MAG: hypothetical protein COT84_06795 [Chlamydiae bacterium CG10_big_fil_rev_8_21_14_0_10_35_9]
MNLLYLLTHPLAKAGGIFGFQQRLPPDEVFSKILGCIDISVICSGQKGGKAKIIVHDFTRCGFSFSSIEKQR